MSEDVCGSCGKEKPKTIEDKIKNHLKATWDETVLGMSVKCKKCTNRLDPTEYVEIYESEKRSEASSEDVKFLQSESLKHGME